MVHIRKTLCVAAGTTAAVLLAAACSVKEDRRECPVYVTVLTDRFVQGGLDAGTVSFSASSLIKRENISFLSVIGKGYTQACPRDYARAAVLSGLDNGRLMEEALIYPPGQQADLLWIGGETFSKNADEYVIDVKPHKEYCLVQFLFDESPRAPEAYPWRFRIKAACAGLNIYTHEPIEGEYSCAVGPNAVGEWYGVLPRQKDNNMLLELFLPYEGSETEGRLDYTIDLGKAFQKTGYDWTAEDLKDVAIKVGFASVEISVTIQDWEGDDSYLNEEI